MPMELLPHDAEAVASENSRAEAPTTAALIQETIDWYQENKVQVENLFALRAAIEEAWEESEREEGIETTGSEILAKLRAAK